MGRPDLDAIGESVARAAFAQPFDEIAYLRARLAETTEIARALETERDRLALTLRCERGEWAPDGWTAKIRGDHLRFVRNGSVRPGRTCDVVQHGGDHAIRWHWWDRTIDSDGEATATHGDGYAPTALEAIEAADAAIREVSGG